MAKKLLKSASRFIDTEDNEHAIKIFDILKSNLFRY